MKSKFFLPMVAMIFAIGMSFANVERASDPSTDYVLINGSFEPIGMELNCPGGDDVCKVQTEPNGQIYNVYDAEDPRTFKSGSGDVIKLWEL